MVVPSCSLSNKIPEIVPQGISHLVQLRVLELGSNRIKKVRESCSIDWMLMVILAVTTSTSPHPLPLPPSTHQIENLEALVNLQELWLGRNRIAQVGGRGMKKVGAVTRLLESK